MRRHTLIVLGITAAVFGLAPLTQAQSDAPFSSNEIPSPLAIPLTYFRLWVKRGMFKDSSYKCRSVNNLQLVIVLGLVYLILNGTPYPKTPKKASWSLWCLDPILLK